MGIAVKFRINLCHKYCVENKKSLMKLCQVEFPISSAKIYNFTAILLLPQVNTVLTDFASVVAMCTILSQLIYKLCY